MWILRKVAEKEMLRASKSQRQKQTKIKSRYWLCQNAGIDKDIQWGRNIQRVKHNFKSFHKHKQRPKLTWTQN